MATTVAKKKMTSMPTKHTGKENENENEVKTQTHSFYKTLGYEKVVAKTEWPQRSSTRQLVRASNWYRMDGWSEEKRRMRNH